MRLRLPVALASILLSLVGCGGGSTPPPTDAGVDAPSPADASTDAGAAPDAEADASVDGGIVIGPITMARNEAYASVMAVEAARDAIAADMRTDALYLSNDLLVTRLDAIIGEEGLVFSAGIIGEEGSMALRSLPTSAVPTIVIVRQLANAIDDIDALRRGWSATTDPLVMALVASLDTLRTRLVTLHALLQARFREIIDTIAVPTETVLPEYQDWRSLVAVPDRAVFHVIAEGRDATSPIADLSWGCPGLDLISIHITDDETGLSVLDMTDTSPGGTATIPLTADRLSSLRIEVDASLGFGYARCDMTLYSERSIRGTELVVFPGEVADLSTRESDLSGRLAMIEGALTMARTEGTPEEIALAGVVEEYLGERLALSGRWRPIPDTTPPAIVSDDLEMLQLELGTVLGAIGLALEASPQMSPTIPNRVSGVLADLMALHGHDDAALLLLAEGDSRPGTAP